MSDGKGRELIRLCQTIHLHRSIIIAGESVDRSFPITIRTVPAELVAGAARYRSLWLKPSSQQR